MIYIGAIMTLEKLYKYLWSNPRFNTLHKGYIMGYSPFYKRIDCIYPLEGLAKQQLLDTPAPMFRLLAGDIKKLSLPPGYIIDGSKALTYQRGLIPNTVKVEIRIPRGNLHVVDLTSATDIEDLCCAHLLHNLGDELVWTSARTLRKFCGGNPSYEKSN